MKTVAHLKGANSVETGDTRRGRVGSHFERARRAVTAQGPFLPRGRLARRLAVGVIVALAPLLIVQGASDASDSPKVAISNVTVTAAKSGGESAVSLSFVNKSKGPVSLISVTSSDATSAMIDFDVNMCQGNHLMSPLTNIFVTAGQTQLLGYKYQGAMLLRVRGQLRSGQTIPLVITWSDFSRAHETDVVAKVVKDPLGIYFGMSGMKM
jgi:copper(I)-binding protein